jgi:hypothetical protein
MAANDMLAVTERSHATGPEPVMDASESVVPEATSHPRVGALAPRDAVEDAVALELPPLEDDGGGPATAPWPSPTASDGEIGPTAWSHSPRPPVSPQPSPTPDPPSWAPPSEPVAHQGWPSGPVASPPPPPGGWPQPTTAGVSAAPPGGAPPGRRSRTPVLILAVVVVLAAGGGLAYAFRPQNGTPTTTGTTAPSVSDVLPVIEQILETKDGADLYWRDDGWPGAAHVLILYSSRGSSIENTANSPQPLQFEGQPQYCFRVAVQGHQERKSQPMCIHGAQADELVKN